MEQEDDVRLCATQRAEDRLIDLIVPPGGTGIDASAVERRREAIRSQLRAALLDERRVDLDVTESSKMPGLSMFGQGSEAMDLSSMLSGLMPTQRKRKNLSVKEAREFLEAVVLLYAFHRRAPLFRIESEALSRERKLRLKCQADVSSFFLAILYTIVTEVAIDFVCPTSGVSGEPRL